MPVPDEPLRIGFQVWAQNVPWPDLMAAASDIEALGFDSMWSNDHFFPIAGYQLEVNHRLEGPIFGGWATLAGFVARTRRMRVGCMVSAAGYRNPGLLVKMASTLDHAARGRLVLGIGAGWYGEARMSVARSEMVGPLCRVGEALARYSDAGAAQVVFDWPAPFDGETLDAPAALRSELRQM